MTVYVHRKELKLPLTHYAGYKERHPDSHKGFVVTPSDRDAKNEVISMFALLIDYAALFSNYC